MKMKKLICFIMMCFMCISITACGGSNQPQPAEFGDNVSIDGFEMNVSGDILVAKQINGDKAHNEEFLTTQLTYYGTVLCDVVIAAQDGYTNGVVDFSLKNVSKSGEKFDVPIQLSYGDGFIYDVDDLYYNMGQLSSWQEFTSLELDPLTSVQCKAAFCVPEEVFLNEEEPLKLIIGEYEFTIR